MDKKISASSVKILYSHQNNISNEDIKSTFKLFDKFENNFKSYLLVKINVIHFNMSINTNDKVLSVIKYPYYGTVIECKKSIIILWEKQLIHKNKILWNHDDYINISQNIEYWSNKPTDNFINIIKARDLDFQSPYPNFRDIYYNDKEIYYIIPESYNSSSCQIL